VAEAGVIGFSELKHRYSYIPAVLLVLTTACSHKSSSEELQHSKLPFGVMDAPQNGAAVRGKVGMGGWALCEGGIAQVIVYLDRDYVTQSRLRLPRPDVAKAFPSFIDAATAGWNAVLDTTPFPPGNHEVVVQAKCNTGATRDLSVIHIIVSK
jgi:hypothetical protein